MLHLPAKKDERAVKSVVEKTNVSDRRLTADGEYRFPVKIVKQPTVVKGVQKETISNIPKILEIADDTNPYTEKLSKYQPEIASRLVSLFAPKFEFSTPSTSEEDDEIESQSVEEENLVSINVDGVIKKVPKLIPCHRCASDMRICLRAVRYKGERKQYPSYRCIRKGCQTFCAIKKLLLPSFDERWTSPVTTIFNNVYEYDDIPKEYDVLKEHNYALPASCDPYADQWTSPITCPVDDSTEIIDFGF
ncbi:unnamed protein product [Caenorhabditis bovis]|uniref:Uncharacterized protein n=1 Tax=Caenorhabditis bovis TaxID=2654633 RepID=A0A8S1F883_9PELO|nr:unnamed protein product [Caenorhabditis bovis]